MRRPIQLFLLVPMLASAAGADGFDTGEQREGYKRIASPPLSILMQGAVQRADGMLVIHPGHHSAQANAYHQALCTAYGGMDVTDQNEVVVSPPGGDSFGCKLARPPTDEPAFTHDIAVDDQGRIYRWVPADPATTQGRTESAPAQPCMPENQANPAISTFRIEPHAVQGRVPKDRPYNTYSWVDFLDVPYSAQFAVDSTVFESNPCHWHQSGVIDAGPGMRYGGTPVCMADRTQGVRSWIQGCHASTCNSDEQWVIHR